MAFPSYPISSIFSKKSLVAVVGNRRPAGIIAYSATALVLPSAAAAAEIRGGCLLAQAGTATFGAGSAWLLAGVLAAGILAALSWAVTLRRRLQERNLLINRLRIAETSLHEKYRGVLESTGDFTFTANLKGLIKTINPAGEDMTGYSGDEIAELKLQDLISCDGDPSPWAALENGEENEICFEGSLSRRDGTAISVATHLRLLSGKPSGILGVVRQRKDRKKIEEEVKQAWRAADMSARAKAQFLAKVGHELRTPMNAIIGMSDLLLGTKLDPQQEEFTETIRKSADSLLGVVDSVLDFSRSEMGQLELEVIDFDLRDTLESTVELLAPDAVAKELDLIVFLAPSEPSALRGDPGRLRQVILNLLGNAIKYTSDGRIIVRVSALEETSDSARLCFEVEDTGIGIPEESIPLLFHPFDQAGDAGGPAFGKPGLGLSIARQIIESMDGAYGVRSDPGVGSTFWFELTLLKQVSGRQSAPIEHWLEETSDRRLLLVAGQKVHTKLLDVYIRALGMSRLLTRDREQALESLQDAARGGTVFDAIIIDHGPPGLNGLGLIETIRAEYEEELPPIILLAPKSEELSSQKLKKLGIAARVSKPVRLGAFAQSTVRTLRIGAERAARRAEAEAKSDGESGKAEDPVTPPEDIPEEKPKSLHVLLAEDDRVNQRVALLLLKKLGHSCDVAVNGNEVLRLLTRGSYDVILMDCLMPEMDGFQCTRKIRERFPKLNYRIIAVTANAMQGDREKCLAAGMDDYLSKPLRLPQLQAALESVEKNH